MHGDGLGEQGMIAYDAHALPHAVADVGKADQPALKIHAGVAKRLDVVIRDAATARFIEDRAAVQAGHPAVVMADHGDLLGPKGIHRYEDRAHDSAERMAHDGPGGL